MTASTIDPATGNLLVNGEPVFPLGLSDPPPLGTTAPSGQDAWAEITSAGTGFVRNYTVWTQVGLDEQLIAVGEQLDAAPAHGLQLWLALAGIDNDLSQQPLLDQVVNRFKGHPGLERLERIRRAGPRPRSRRGDASPSTDMSNRWIRSIPS